MSDETKRPSEFVSQIRDHTRKYLQDLNEENEMLRQKAEVLECDRHILEGSMETLRAELEAERIERQKLFRRLESLEHLRESSAAEYAIVEEQNNNLASLYSATYSLHGTVDRDRIVGVIQEIVANLIGSEEMGIFEWDQSDSELRLLASVGIEESAYLRLSPDDGIIGHTARSRKPYFAGRGRPGAATASGEENLTACMPLAIEDLLIGVIAVFRLLPQKQSIEAIDYELFELLGIQAAMALYTARLHELATATRA